VSARDLHGRRWQPGWRPDPGLPDWRTSSGSPLLVPTWFRRSPPQAYALGRRSCGLSWISGVCAVLRRVRGRRGMFTNQLPHRSRPVSVPASGSTSPGRSRRLAESWHRVVTYAGEDSDHGWQQFLRVRAAEGPGSR